tara:strand:+ start:4033 stop:4191 length:159 start_codon:yes stop_codon:yes gene_type:complete
MGQSLAKCIGGETDYNRNGVPDNKEIQRLIESYITKQKEKRNKTLLKKVLKK